MISDKEIEKFWAEWDIRNVKWFSFSALGVLTTGVFWAYFLKHVVKIKFKFWWLNDTVDGDHGGEQWLKDKNLKKGFWTTIKWWIRNHSWNFIYKYLPFWKNGEVDRNAEGKDFFRVILCTIPYHQMLDNNGKYNRFTKANKKEGVYGINYYAYKINGITYCNYSYASPKIEKQFGAGGNEWRCWIKF